MEKEVIKTKNFLLASKALGYESCWYEGHELVCLLPIGVATEKPVDIVKKSFEERTWFNHIK